jgi:hypothetical protein
MIASLEMGVSKSFNFVLTDFNFSHSFRHVLSIIGGIRARSWDAKSSYAHQTAAQCRGMSLQSGFQKFGMSAPNCFRL